MGVKNGTLVQIQNGRESGIRNKRESGRLNGRDGQTNPSPIQTLIKKNCT